MDHRAGRLEEDFGHGAHVSGIGRGAQRLHRRIIEFTANAGFDDVGWNFNENRARLPRPHLMERSPHEFRNPAGLVQVRRPFRDVTKVLDRAECRRRMASADGGGAGQQQHRHIIREHLGRAGKRVLDSRPALHRKDPDALTVRRAADAISNTDSDPFLAANHRPNADFHAGVNQQLAGIADEVLDSLGLQYPRDRVSNLHF